MTTPIVYCTRILPPEARSILTDAGWNVLEYPDQNPCPPEVILKEAQKATAIICMLTETFDKALIDGLPNLKLISNYAAGFNNVDIDYATHKNILVGNTPDVLTQSTAEVTISLILAMAKNLYNENIRIRNGEWNSWNPLEHLGMEIHGKHLGILGFGRIGQKVAEICSNGFGMNIMTTKSKNPELEKRLGVKVVSRDELFSLADFITLHIPLNNETRFSVGAEEFAKMKQTSFLINTARGEVVNTNELMNAVKSGEIAGAGLDVTDPEPLPKDHPILQIPGIFITPHIGSATRTARVAMGMKAAQNVAYFSNSRHLGDYINLSKINS